MQVLTHADVADLDREAFYSPRSETAEQFGLSIEGSALLGELEDALKAMRKAQFYLHMALSGVKSQEDFVGLVSRAWATLEPAVR
jgi:hypothetical protein